jgi:hypothetical protein
MYMILQRLRIIKHISTNLQSKEAKIGWLCNRKFMLMKSDVASINSISFCNRDAVKNYFDNLMLVMEKHNLVEREIFNVDKAWLSNVPKHYKSLGPKGQKQVVQLFLGNEGWMELLCAVSGSGSFIPRILVYPRLRVLSEFGKVCPVPAIYSCSKNVLINELFFLGFSILKIVSKYLTTIHASHISHQICDYCKGFGIIVCYFQPRNSPRLQPLSIKCEGALITVLTGRVMFPLKEVHVKGSCSTAWLNFSTECVWG